MIVSGAETETKDFNWLQRHIEPGAHCVLTNVTSGMGVLSVMGPRARELLQSLTPDDLSDAAFPFATSRVIELAFALVRASRITYVGELGWELYVPTEFMQGVYDELASAGAAYGLVHAGYHALNSLRIEKAYRHWGHDITDEDTPLEAGLGFAVKFDKPGGFIGREALLRQRQSGCRKRLVQFKLEVAGAPAVPQRAHLAGRCDRRVHSLRHVRTFPRRGRGLGLRDGRGRRPCVGDDRRGRLRDRGRRRALCRHRLATPAVRPEERANQVLSAQRC